MLRCETAAVVGPTRGNAHVDPGALIGRDQLLGAVVDALHDLWTEHHLLLVRDQSLTPERAIEVQCLLGADIQMVLDECTPFPASREQAASSIDRKSTRLNSSHT